MAKRTERRGERVARAAGWVPVAAAAIACMVASPIDARACGGFFSRRTTTRTVSIPSLEVEQVLILHDAATEEEHFIREIVFRDAKEAFGFVVPTPSQPTVAKVEKSPFAALAARFPPEPPEPPGGLKGLGGGGGRGLGDTGSGAAPKVVVLSQQRVGSFTAFVLAATDASAMKKWLDDNELTTTPESEAWLKHYVDLGFYFTAFRYEVSASKGTAASKSETVRLSFKTPLPYYPYKEPEHEAPPTSRPRVLSVWLVGAERSVPVATAASRPGDTPLWKRPWAEPMKHAKATASELARLVGDEHLIPSGTVPDGGTGEPRLVVQTFQDQKRSRRGFGDVVMVPAAPRATDAAKLARMDKLMATLDPAIGGAK